jgi:bifunctional non-homologous end joining protein LigD
MSLEEYHRKRDFRTTPEPSGAQPIFVVQEHHASRHHFDFRLEADGVLKSWAVPKGPSLDPSRKRLAVRVEDHPLSYATFEGTIPEGHYGAGTVTVWDHGTYENLTTAGGTPRTVAEGIDDGRLEFALHGGKLGGRFVLTRMRRHPGGKEDWLLIKGRDAFARRASDPPEPERPPGVPESPRVDCPTEATPTTITCTNPAKVFFPDAGITKGDVFAFYQRIAPYLLPHLRERPVTLERLPEGLSRPDAPHFWQKNTPEHYPPWVPRVELTSEDGKPVRYVLVNDLPVLLYLVNQGALTFHPWLSRVQDLDRPDFVLFDLDPGTAALADAVMVARRLHQFLGKEGVEAVVKTSGRAGLHVLTPWSKPGGYDEARAWALSVAERLVTALPAVATLERTKAKRGGRVYMDVLQNARGHHVVPPYVLRAVPGATVSTPLEWGELTPALDPSAFNLRTIFRRLGRKKRDPTAVLAASNSSGSS